MADGGRHEPVAVETARSIKVERAEQPLYVNRIKVYPKQVSGFFRRLKWAALIACLAVYYLAPWLRWNRGAGAPDQAILIDMGGRRAYFFDIEIWPQEVYFLTGLLILGAVGLFLATALLGRVWCGHFCPQTVWTDLFMWVERLIEGDRAQRMRLDQAPWGARKTALKIAKHAAWLAIALVTGGAWILYFGDAPSVVREFFTLEASAPTYFFVGLFTATTYTLAGWAREQVCTYMCPWPRFQAAMLDDRSLVVTYQAWRGEPRGKHKAGQAWEGRGDCVDCNACVAVCPTGIDIRDGQQLECIGCGLCIDACNAIMPRVGRPANLITFDTLANQDAKAKGQPPEGLKLIRPRTVIYAAVLALVGAVMLAALWLRPTVEINVLRDRAPLFVTLADGRIRNDYTVKILNKTRAAHSYVLDLTGIPGVQISVTGVEPTDGRIVLTARPDSVAQYRVHVAAPRASLAAESTPIGFELRDVASQAVVRYGAAFLAPGR